MKNEKDNGMSLVVLEQINAVELFASEKVDPLLEGIKSKAMAHVPDLSTKKSRDEIASMAYKVAQSKTALDGMRKDLVADKKAEIKKVDESGKYIRDCLDYLKAEVRRPLTEWEIEDERKKEEARKLAEYLADWDSAIADNELFDREREIARKEAEFKRQEEERRQKEEAERLEKERIEREERLKKEAEEKARREAEEKAEREKEEIRKREAQAKLDAEKAQREKEEAELKARLEAERMEREKKEATEKAERDRIEAEKRAEAEKQAAIDAERKRAQEEAEQKEAKRLEAERIERERLEALAADKEHRAQINREALADLMKIVDEDTGKAIISAIAKGDVSNVSINY